MKSSDDPSSRINPLQTKAMTRKKSRSMPQSANARMAKLRARRQKVGSRQITAFLSAEATALLSQMIEFSGSTQGELLSAAISSLAFDYEHWGISPPESEEDDLYGWDPGAYDSRSDNSHYRNFHGDRVENPNFGKPVPPWIVESERISVAEHREIMTEISSTNDIPGIEVYKRGVSRNR
jgi:hypothetical protein